MAEKAALPFLGALADTAGMIEQLRTELAAVEGQRDDLDVKVSDIKSRIAAWNQLRQAHGLAPL